MEQTQITFTSTEELAYPFERALTQMRDGQKVQNKDWN
jgi:hypothetical protein